MRLAGLHKQAATVAFGSNEDLMAATIGSMAGSGPFATSLIQEQPNQ